MGGVGSGRQPKVRVKLPGAAALSVLPKGAREIVPPWQRDVLVLVDTLKLGIAEALGLPKEDCPWWGTLQRGLDGKARAKWQQAAIVAFSSAGVTQAQIAALMGLDLTVVRAILYEFHRSGALVADLEARMDGQVLPAVVDALTRLADKDHAPTVLAVAQGRGLLPHLGRQGGGSTTVTPTLQVNFTLPEGVEKPALTAQVVGKAKE